MPEKGCNKTGGPDEQRRSFLKTIGAGTGLAMTGAGGTILSSTPASAKTRVNIVEDYGADNTGSSTIDAELENAAAADTIIEFPPGEYLVEGYDSNRSGTYNGFDWKSTYDGLEWRGTDATLVQTNRNERSRWLHIDADNFVFDGFEVDFRDIDYPGNFYITANDWEFKNVVFRGQCHVTGSDNTDETLHGITLIRPAVPSSGSRGLIQDVYFHDGSADAYEYSNRRAILILAENYGHIVFNRCWFEMWGENTLYVNKSNGPLSVFNCYFRNTKDPLRIGGDSEVRGCTFIKDGGHPLQGWTKNKSYNGGPMRGVNVEGDDSEAYPGRIDITDCDFKHTYQAPDGYTDQTGSCINSGTVCEEINIDNCRMLYHGDRARHAVELGANKDLKSLQIKDTKIENNYDPYYGVFLEQTPNNWETVSGIIGGTGKKTNNSHVDSNMTTGSDSYDAPVNTSNPCRPVPSVGQTPMEDTKLLRIDSTNGGRTDYSFEASGKVWIAGDNGASIDLEPGGDTVNTAAGTASGWCDGLVDAYLFTGELTSATNDGDANWYVDGQQIDPSNVEGGSSEPQTIDGFEDGYLSEYSVEPLQVSPSSSAARSGSYGLDMNGADGDSGVTRSDSGLNAYPGPDETWEFWWNTQTLQQAFSVHFGIQSSSDLTEGFRLNFGLGGGYVEFQERGTSGNNYIGSTSFSPSTNTWYRTVVDGTAGTDKWTVTVDRGATTSPVAEFTTSATQYGGYGKSGIAYYISGADQVYLDDLTVGTGTTTVDGFEDGYLSEYSVEPLQVSPSSSAAHSGSYGLDMNGADGDSGVTRSDSGLNAYPGPDETWEFWWNAQTLQQAFSVHFGIQSSSDLTEGFRLNFGLGGGYVEFQERGTSGNNYIGSTSFSPSTNTWYRTVVNGSDASDAWTVTIDQGGTSTVAEFTTSATQYGGYGKSGIAYYISGADQVYLDDVALR